MNIKISEIEECLNEIFQDLKSRGIDEISLLADFYWNIPSEAIYEPYNEPPQLDIGQLEDDYLSLLNARDRKKLTGHNLKDLAALLRYISEKYPA